MFKNIKTIFFDYDGTLHNSIKIYAPAFRKAYRYLVDNEFTQERKWTDDEISYWLGFSSKDMWKEFMPDLDEDIRNRASKIIGEEMLNQLSDDKAELYDGAIEVLQYLKEKKYKLVFVSNCGIYYRDMARKLFDLDNYFEEMACSEEYEYIPKYEIVKKIKENYPSEMVIIGDRIQDIECGIRNKINTIACNFGYGSKEELSSADYEISNIAELMEIL
ncbi:HAD family hydrolase [Tepidibacter mesophilus]|uniref:HAD family hydrolase n=1 Tax=Tepidibacter mesophilus TaxID=655607 RepID=UPI000C0773D9|nr:HAD family hydrolase [Tepidibacter mesophilus]